MSWTVLDDIHLPNVPVTDLALREGAGVLRAATYGRGVFDFAVGTGPVIAINAQNGLSFGNSCGGSSDTLLLQIFNTGTQDLIVNSVARLMGSTAFSVLPNPSTPVAIGPHAEVDFTLRYSPSSPTASDVATIRISSNDPNAPNVDLTAQAAPSQVSVTGTTAFGNVCAGTVVTKTVTICNTGLCSLHVPSAAFSPYCDDFKLVTNPFPVQEDRGACTQLAVQFTPICWNPNLHTRHLERRSCSPEHETQRHGDEPLAQVSIAPDESFPDTVIHSVGSCTSQQPFPIANTGVCPISVNNVAITKNAGEYSLSGLPSLPSALGPGQLVGGGSLAAVFGPAVVDRDRLGEVTVTYVSNPISGAGRMCHARSVARVSRLARACSFGPAARRWGPSTRSSSSSSAQTQQSRN